MKRSVGLAGVAVILAIILLGVVVGFLVSTVPTIGPSGVSTEAGAITFWHDDVRHVGCWVYHSGYKGGLACLPDGQYVP